MWWLRGCAVKTSMRVSRSITASFVAVSARTVNILLAHLNTSISPKYDPDTYVLKLMFLFKMQFTLPDRIR